MEAATRGGDSSASSTPSMSRHAGVDMLAGPITPSSVASEAHAIRRKVHHPAPPPRELLIRVLRNGTAYPLQYSWSGTDDFFIDEIKLNQLGISPHDWASPPPRQVELGGRMIQVYNYVTLDWSHEHESNSRRSDFWILSPGTIKHADVLLASGLAGQPWGLHPSSHSPSGFGPSARPPAVPNPPPAAPTYGQDFTSSSGFYSISSTSSPRAGQRSDHGLPPDIPRQRPLHHTSQGSRPIPSYASTVRPSESPTPSHRSARASAPGNPSAPDGGSKPGGADMVTVTICPQSAPDKASSRAVNLNAAPEAVLTRIRSSLGRVPGYDNPDWDMVQLSITPLGSGDVNPQDLTLDTEDFKNCWNSAVKFMRRYRAPELDSEFRFDIVLLESF
ncbi:hypothetical protein F5X68DRAFT_15880 [Plectosphaerella plurivora]|uniref:Uncharacterized protein n=1 Tax=Plectosphaerella plurivora TaxID=936078 RepID=A0A9P8VAE3_9PEZI|nr:hypothetical protein F5X68DRAFT_15880 [Plectosphaerella plurivora]